MTRYEKIKVLSIEDMAKLFGGLIAMALSGDKDVIDIEKRIEWLKEEENK